MLQGTLTVLSNATHIIRIAIRDLYKCVRRYFHREHRSLKVFCCTIIPLVCVCCTDIYR